MKAETLWSNQRSPADDWAKWQGKGALERRAGSFQRLKRLRQRLSVRIEAMFDLSRYSGDDSKLLGCHFRAFPGEASALSATFCRFVYSATDHGDRQRRVTSVTGLSCIYVQPCEWVHRPNSAGKGLLPRRFCLQCEILDSKSCVEMGRGPAACGHAPLDSSVGHQGLASAYQVGDAGALKARLFGVCHWVADPPFGNSRNRSVVL